MPSENERKALWFLALVALSGSGVRLWRARTPPPAADSVAIQRQLARVDSAQLAGPARKAAKPTRGQRKATDTTRVAPVDLDRATAEEIERLPGIGPALAGRIVARRDSLGAFGGIDALCDVRGVGPALVERLRPLVTFSGPYRPVSVACGGASKDARRRPVNRAIKPG